MKKVAKKILLSMLGMVLCAVLLLPWVTALASSGTDTGQVSAAVTFNATPIVAGVIVLIGVALGAVLLWLTYKFIVPLLKVPIVGTLAKWAVDLAEQALGRGGGDAKFDMAAAYVVKALGWLKVTVDQASIKAAIISAWTALNFAQIAAGIKAATSSAETAEKPPDR